MTRPADERRAGGNDAVRAAQCDERVHCDLSRRKAVHKVNVHHGQLPRLVYAAPQAIYGEQGACQQKNGAQGEASAAVRDSSVFTAAITGRSTEFRQEDALDKTPFFINYLIYIIIQKSRHVNKLHGGCNVKI